MDHRYLDHCHFCGKYQESLSISCSGLCVECKDSIQDFDWEIGQRVYHVVYWEMEGTFIGGNRRSVLIEWDRVFPDGSSLNERQDAWDIRAVPLLDTRPGNDP